MSEIQDKASTEAMEEIKIKQLESQIIRAQEDAKRWRLLVERYAEEPSSYPLIDELRKEAL